MKHFVWVLGAALVAVAWAPAGTWRCSAEIRDSFETPDPSWELRDHDCALLRITEHRRTFDHAHWGSGSEYLKYRAGRGTTIHLTHPVPRAPVIQELIPSLWVKGTRPGIRLSARVVFPRSKDPNTGRPLTALLPGSVYETPGEWQQLRVTDLPRLLFQQTVVLRAGGKTSVDPAEAYIDMLVVNAYTERGTTELWLDDLELAGFASTSPSGTLVSAGDAERAPSLATEPLPAASDSESHPPEVERQGSLLMVDGRPLFARIVEHNGEPFSVLKSLGFNVIKLAQPPTSLQLEQAQTLDLWLLAPPPTDAPQYNSDRVLAWMVGEQLTGQDWQATSQRCQKIRTKTGARRRPLAGHLADADPRYADVADIPIHGREIIGTSFQLSEYQAWLEQQREAFPGDQPFWACVQTQFTRSQLEQYRLLHSSDQWAPLVEPEQIRLQAYHAIAAGARGICFRSRSRLDAQDPATRLRSATLKLLNHQLSILEPWLAAGQVGNPIQTRNPQIQVPVLETQRCQLLLIMREDADQQYSVGPYEPDAVSLAIYGTPITSEAYRVTESGLEPLSGRIGHAAQITVDSPGLATMVALTHDPLVVTHLGRAIRQQRQEVAELQVEIADMQLEQTRRVVRGLERQGRDVQTATRWLEHAESFVRGARQLLFRGDTASARRFTKRTSNLLRRVRRRHWSQASIAFPSPISSPLCASFSTLPAHWEMVQRMQAVRWTPTTLSAGDCEDLEQLTRSGWVQHHATDPAIESSVVLSQHARNGQSSLRLQAGWSRSGRQPGRIGSWPLSITTEPIAVRQGELVRIHGWAKVPQPLSGSPEGLLVFDSLTGPQRAESIPHTSGWREFTLYRAAPASGELTVVFALTGLGEAFLDDVSVSRIR